MERETNYLTKAVQTPPYISHRLTKPGRLCRSHRCPNVNRLVSRAPYNIEDLMDLYALVLDLGLEGNPAPDAYGHFFFGSAGEHVRGKVAHSLAGILCGKGLVETSEVEIIALEDEPGLLATATNSRSIANRGLALGWKPSRPGLMELLSQEVEWTVEQMKDPSRAPNKPIPYGIEDK